MSRTRGHRGASWAPKSVRQILNRIWKRRMRAELRRYGEIRTIRPRNAGWDY
jgi:hypothetical protein